jgi:glc operon protein GlcG
MKIRPLMTVVLGVVLCALMANSARAQLPNPYGPAISVETARKLAATATAEGKKNGWTVAVAVVDTAGELVLFERMDNTQSGSITVAQEKARTAARFKRPTKAFEEAVAGGRQVILSLPGATPIEGGIPLLIDGKIVGAIGVSGATSPQDGICAQAAVDTLGKAPGAAPPPAKAPAPPPKK